MSAIPPFYQGAYVRLLKNNQQIGRGRITSRFLYSSREIYGCTEIITQATQPAVKIVVEDDETDNVWELTYDKYRGIGLYNNYHTSEWIERDSIFIMIDSEHHSSGRRAFECWYRLFRECLVCRVEGEGNIKQFIADKKQEYRDAMNQGIWEGVPYPTWESFFWDNIHEYLARYPKVAPFIS